MPAFGTKKGRPGSPLWFERFGGLFRFLGALFPVIGLYRGVQSRQHLLGLVSMWTARLQLKILLVSLGGSVRSDYFAAGIGGCHSDKVLPLPEISIGTVGIRGYGLVEGIDCLLAGLNIVGGV